MKILVSGQASAHDDETGEIITDAARLQSLGGLRYDGDLCANYLDHEQLNDISIVGGAIEVVWAPDQGGLRVVSEYWSPVELSPDQLQALTDQTLGQWSDGIGEGCFDEWSQESGIGLDLAPFTRDDYQDPVAEQVDDGREVPRFAHLAKAVWRGKLDVVQQAVAERADLNAVYDGHTALLLAIMKKDVAIALLLIEGGADVDRGSVIGTTPLMACTSLPPADAMRVAKALVARGCDLDAVDYEGQTAATMAANNNQRELAEFLRTQRTS